MERPSDEGQIMSSGIKRDGAYSAFKVLTIRKSDGKYLSISH